MHCLVCRTMLGAADTVCAQCSAPTQPSEGRRRPSNERKYLTLLCADLRQSTALIAGLEPEAAVARLEPALAAMRAAVRRNDGIVSKEMGDGLIALFGAPRADDNHALLACHAALELTQGIAALADPAIQVRVGLHSAYVVAHLVETDYSSVYEAAGPALHLVDRLQHAAEAGTAVASESVRDLAEGLVTFLTLSEARLPGFPQPIALHQVTGTSGQSRWRARAARGMSPFVGRSDEIAALRRATAEPARIPGRALAIVGEPGIGKSRTVHEVLDALGREPWGMLELECDPTRRSVPYAALKTLLQLALRRLDGAQRADVPGFPEAWRDALRLVLDQPIDGSAWSDLEPVARRRAVVDACRATIERVAASRPTILLIEDLHWIDAESSACIQALVALTGRCPLLLLLTSRREGEPTWFDLPQIERLRLAPLDHAAAETMLDALIGGGEELRPLKARILQHTGGVPLFVEEVARQLADIDRRGAGGATTSWERLCIPPTVQGVIATRIDRLPPPHKALLQVAATIGPRATKRLLCAATGLSDTVLRSQLELLETTGLLLEAPGAPEPSCRFPHDLVREVAYDSILQPQRARLHGGILAALEATADIRDLAEDLCHHAIAARLSTKVALYGHSAAQRCLARSAFRDAARHFLAAIQAVDDLPFSTEREQRAIDLRIEARSALFTSGEMDNWLRLSAEAERRAAAIGDSRRELATMAVRAGALSFVAPPAEAIAAGERALRRALELSDEAWSGFAAYGLGQACFNAGRFREAAELFGRSALAPAHALGAGAIVSAGARLDVLSHMMKGLAHALLGEPAAADTAEGRAAALAVAGGRAYDTIAAGYCRGVVRMLHGDIAAAAEALDGALALSRRDDIRQFLPALLCQRGNVHLQQGQAVPARDMLQAAVAEAGAIGHTVIQTLAGAYLGVALGQLGEGGRAAEIVRGALATAAQQGYAWAEAQGQVAMATILMSRKEPDLAEAERCLRAAGVLARQTGSGPVLAAAQSLRARLLARIGDRDGAVREMREVVELLGRMGLAGHVARAKAALAALAPGDG